MAYYRRCLSIRTSLLARRSSSSFCRISHEDDRGKAEEYRPLRSAMDSYVSQRRSFGSYVKGSSWRYSGVSLGVGSGMVGSRYMSTSFGTELKKFLISKYPALDVIIPAVGSSLPVPAVQCLIDGIHSFTGLNWWSSIAITTLLVRGVTIPFLIYEAKCLKKLECTEILIKLLSKEVFRGLRSMKDMDPESRAKAWKRIRGLCGMGTTAIFKVFGTRLMGTAIRAPISVSFVLAVTIMADAVPSFKSGGALWFTDLTTPDCTLAFQSLTLLSFFASFRAAYCYMLTSNMFSVGVNSCFSSPNVRKALGFPESPVPIPSFFTDRGRKNIWPSFYKR